MVCEEVVPFLSPRGPPGCCYLLGLWFCDLFCLPVARLVSEVPTLLKPSGCSIQQCSNFSLRSLYHHPVTSTGCATLL